jgi:uncharacterized protein (TIGR03067 family)
MKKKLPARPNVEHLRSQAKVLLNELKAGDKGAAGQLIKYLPAAKNKPVAQILKSQFRLADAQSVIARKNNFSSWPALIRHVEKLRDLEGTWQFVTMEVDGRAMPAPALANSRMLIDGDRFRMESIEATYEGIFTIDVEQVPHTIDIDFVEGPEAGNSSAGIFELSGDEFKICLGLTGVSRPCRFATSPGSGHALETLRRVLNARPDNVKGGVARVAPGKPETPPVDASAFDVPMSPLLEKLQGEWLPTQLVQNGQALEAMMLAFGSRTFSRNETKVVFGGQVMLHAKMRVDEAHSPVRIDYLNLHRSSVGTVSLGILDWVGDEVRICMSAAGQPRASDFTSDAGSGRTLSSWRRK